MRKEKITTKERIGRGGKEEAEGEKKVKVKDEDEDEDEDDKVQNK